MGIDRLPFLFIGLLVSLLMVAFIPTVRISQELAETRVHASVRGDAVIVIDILFWVLLPGLLVAVVLAYL
jgi:hypothetical protein